MLGAGPCLSLTWAAQILVFYVKRIENSRFRPRDPDADFGLLTGAQAVASYLGTKGYKITYILPFFSFVCVDVECELNEVLPLRVSDSVMFVPLRGMLNTRIAP